MSSQTKKQPSKARVRKSRSTTTKQLKPKSTAPSSCLFCLRNRRRCVRVNGQAQCSECTALCQTCHWPNAQQNLHQLLHEKQQLYLQRRSLSKSLLEGVRDMEFCSSTIETQRTLKRLLDDMVNVEQRAFQLESEESRLWGLRLRAQDSDDIDSEDSCSSGILSEPSQSLDYNFAFPWLD
ncbi:uncharacterized protein FPRO_07671 [Fusarium proliferatum ET1]|uniref:Zn(2)-C6 fungal-type domain-containing protein n=1 Tax=Fusarium proliferatum (strain ET1) TaxID=1227346 RepID=A0A1L7VSL4_FUSPR|nr:uncharacterized protein FPRO_07671 [Fusarium proliferatum ET1]CZR43412.1 uncharacterized protein FPRO_07671 [Fusarium proliferatum ET1]